MNRHDNTLDGLLLHVPFVHLKLETRFVELKEDPTINSS